MQLDLVLPAYNPSAGWVDYALERIEELERLRPQWQIHLYIAPDASQKGHSPQERAQLEEAMQGRLTYIVYSTNRGKGYALRRAVAATLAPYVMYTDWDFPFTTESYLATLDALEAGAEVVLPLRARAEYLSHLSPIRKCLSRGSSLINTLLLALPYRDTQGGIKAFALRGREVFLATEIDRFLFDTEFIALAHRQGVEICQTECHIRPDIRLSSMSLKTLRSELRYVPRLLVARWFS